MKTTETPMNPNDQGVPAPTADRADLGLASADVEVLVIGAGQAGLALGWHLRQQRRSFLLVDAGAEVGHVWRSRWDSLRLFTPAEYDALPGLPFPAPAGTYPTKDQVADYLRDYAATFSLPVRLNTRVNRLHKLAGRFHAETSTGVITADQVAIATGPFQIPFVPQLAAGFADDVTQVHSAAYRNPDQLPDGPVLVVGAANSGLQIAAELAASRPVTLAVGSRPPMLPQRFLGRDLFWWLTRLGALSKTADSPLARRTRKRGDLVIGTRPRDLARRQIATRPRIAAAAGHEVTFADGSTSEVQTVIWATGFREDYSWVDIPGPFVEDRGTVSHTRGVTTEPGLSILGLPWLHTRGSALLGFVKDDAAWLADRIANGPAASDRQDEAARRNRVVSGSR
jgi:putative flavoprotein involved in K+ transport